jgi:uncharacterized protein with NAD-binding domain and iron-sulfur cluster
VGKSRGSNKRDDAIRVAIVGGGCAALTAAFELTRPEHAGRFAVTVYQMGWRLGGKGASGRGVASRIEEHGLHLWMGFYENAFRIMRDCYAELATHPGARRFSTWTDAFSPAPTVAVTDRMGSGGDAWDHWVAHFPPGGGLPGDALPEGGPFTVAGYLRRSAMLVRELVRSATAMGNRRGVQPNGPAGGSTGGPAGTGSTPASETIAAAVEAVLRYGRLATMAAIVEAAELLRQSIDAWGPPVRGAEDGVVLRLIEALAAAARRQLEQLVGADPELRRVWTVIDLILAILRGATVSRLALDPRGFDALNDYDWREWLRLHGASEQSLDSGFMRGIYDLTFAFERGDVTRPRLAAGVALRGAMRMFFTYRGSLFWRMNAGMGDVVFAPLYEVLRRRGVRFEFFHRLRRMRLSRATAGERAHIRALDFDVQARVRGGGEYRPLIDVRGVPSWRAQPDYAQLVNGAALAREQRAFEGHWETRRAGTKQIHVTDDFDFIVLGIGIGAVPSVASELIEREPRWRDMVEHVQTVPTQAFQVWLREDVQTLGWSHPPASLSGFVEPFDTWADMGHLIGQETWRAPVKAIAYFCSVFPDNAGPNAEVTRDFHRRQQEIVRQNAVRFLERDVRALWPGAMQKRGGFRWSLLVHEPNVRSRSSARNGERAFDTQYWVANVNPSDRYVLSLPGSLKYRLSPLDVSFDNLTIAGDWTATGLDSGCIESAVMSGRLAAHALSQQPPLNDIVGYDHP